MLVLIYNKSMKTEELNYTLPTKLIAQKPLKKRDSSRLLVLDKNDGKIHHDVFHHLGNYLYPGDVLVLNDTKVIPARIIGYKSETRAVIELLLLKNTTDDLWECMVKPAKRIKVGTEVIFDQTLKAVCVDKLDDGLAIFEFIYEGIFLEILSKLGTMPLPPYIKEQLTEQERYQTVYAKHIGSAAAPTAGLHFTEELLQSLLDVGIVITYVTLHVGLGTFLPINTDDISNHKMHEEYFMISDETARILNKAKAEGRRIISVGTTTTRVLETNYHLFNRFNEASGMTNIFIYPGFEFKAIDGLITNFHLPKSTLLLLVSAFASQEIILNAYREAIKKEYRFFSFGDAMFITKELL